MMMLLHLTLLLRQLLQGFLLRLLLMSRLLPAAAYAAAVPASTVAAVASATAASVVVTDGIFIAENGGETFGTRFIDYHVVAGLNRTGLERYHRYLVWRPA
jgi:hypothetical protein